MKQAIERALNILLVVSASVIAGAAVHREIRGGGQPATGVVGPPVFHAEWRGILAFGRTAGDTAAPVQIIEFADLECPVCARFQRTTLSTMKERLGNRVAVTIVHFPLKGHRFALSAAQASECAAAQGRFSQFVEVAYAGQDSFGLSPWSEFARKANVANLKQFELCRGQHDFVLIDSGRAIATRVGVHATPTIMVNGWLYQRPPLVEELQKEAESILAGHPRKPAS